MARELVDLRGIGKTFRSGFLLRPFTAIEDLDLSVTEGEIFGFLGPNGAGKTTTLKILLGLIRPTRGRGHVLGHGFGDARARREIGFLPDSPNFYRYLDPRELLRFTGGLQGIPAHDLRDRIDATLDRVGLPEEARSRRLKTYSRGMLQRTGIAAAILHRPRLVILDEPMNGLDPLGRHEFRDLILELKGDGVTVLLSSHVLSDIESTADRVGILHEGRLLKCGSLSEILASSAGWMEVTFRPAPGSEAAEAGRGLEGLRESSQGWVGRVETVRRANEVVRRILHAGGEVLEVHRGRMSLEDFFMQEIRRDGDSGGRAGVGSPVRASGAASVPGGSGGPGAAGAPGAPGAPGGPGGRKPRSEVAGT